jgi:hypothetical protein
MRPYIQGCNPAPSQGINFPWPSIPNPDRARPKRQPVRPRLRTVHGNPTSTNKISNLTQTQHAITPNTLSWLVQQTTQQASHTQISRTMSPFNHFVSMFQVRSFISTTRTRALQVPTHFLLHLPTRLSENVSDKRPAASS